MMEDILPLYDLHERINAEFPGGRREVMTRADGTPILVRHVRLDPGNHFITYANLSAGEADAVIARQVSELGATGQGYTWTLFSHDRPPDLGARLRAAGFEPDVPDAVMALDLNHAPASLLQPVNAGVRRIDSPQQLDDVVTVLEGVWGRPFDWVRRRFPLTMQVQGFLELYVAYVDGQPASVAWAHFQRGSAFATLWGGSTLPQYRGRGLYTALTAARVQSAFRRGRRWAVIMAGDMSRPIAARHGFTQVGENTSYEHAPAA